MALSKPIKPNYSVSVPKGWEEGGTMYNDFHCWVENDAGTVVYDPSFDRYNWICETRGLDVNKPVYKAWPNQTKWIKKHCGPQTRDLKLFHNKSPEKCIKILRDKVICVGLGAMSNMTNRTFGNFYNNPTELMCTYNAYAWYYTQIFVRQRKGLHIKIGSMGWRNMNDNTKAFYEFG